MFLIWSCKDNFACPVPLMTFCLLVVGRDTVKFKKKKNNWAAAATGVGRISGCLLECHGVYTYNHRKMAYQLKLAQKVILSAEGCRTNLSLCPSMAKNAQVWYSCRASEVPIEVRWQRLLVKFNLRSLHSWWLDLFANSNTDYETRTWPMKAQITWLRIVWEPKKCQQHQKIEKLNRNT